MSIIPRYILLCPREKFLMNSGSGTGGITGLTGVHHYLKS
jgi:hypothetical protein